MMVYDNRTPSGRIEPTKDDYSAPPREVRITYTEPTVKVEKQVCAQCGRMVPVRSIVKAGRFKGTCKKCAKGWAAFNIKKERLNA